MSGFTSYLVSFTLYLFCSWKIINDCEYMKIVHVNCGLRANMKAIFTILKTHKAVVKMGPEKIQVCARFEPMTFAITELTSQLGVGHCAGL